MYTDLYPQIKALVLGGMSGYAACKQLREDPLRWAKRISEDPDIVKAKRDGLIPDKGSKKVGAEHYRSLPHVIDVLEHGMTQTEAAKKYGLSQPLVCKHVNKAREQPAPTRSETLAQAVEEGRAPAHPDSVRKALVATLEASITYAAYQVKAKPEDLVREIWQSLMGQSNTHPQ